MTRDALKARVLRFMDSDGVDDSFETLAMDLHRWQRAHAPVIEALCTGPVREWSDIPSVPVALFKSLPIGTVRDGEAAVEFRTSGTTGGGQGVHRLRDTELYDAGAIRHYRRCVPNAPPSVVALLDDPQLSPHSSLSHMVASFTSEAVWAFRDGLKRDVLNSAIRSASGPLFVPTTAFALAEWLQGPAEQLPAGSVLMVTGGFKGRTHAFTDNELYAQAESRLAPDRMVTEYGMTELSSQLWGRPGQPYVPPHWMRVLAVDPGTGTPLPSGTSGQLRFVDLANLDSTVAIDDDRPRSVGHL